MNFKYKNRFSFLVFVLAVLIASGCGSRKASVYLQTPIKVSAEQFYNDYKNLAEADKKYLAKLLEIDGLVERIGDDSTGQSYVIFKGGDSLGEVQCFFMKTLKEQAAQLKKDERITLKGICLSKIVNAAVDECQIVKK